MIEGKNEASVEQALVIRSASGDGECRIVVSCNKLRQDQGVAMWAALAAFNEKIRGILTADAEPPRVWPGLHRF